MYKQIETINDIPLHLEIWIDKHLYLSKENVKFLMENM